MAHQALQAHKERGGSSASWYFSIYDAPHCEEIGVKENTAIHAQMPTSDYSSSQRVTLA